MSNQVVAPMNLESVSDKQIPVPGGFTQIGGPGAPATSGLSKANMNANAQDANDIICYLKKLNYEPLDSKDNLWDCQERALWGIVHARRMFPGCAIGMVEGKGQEGGVAGVDHAAIVVWERGLEGYRYWDPLFPDKDDGTYKFDPHPVRIIAFPFGVNGDADMIDPISHNMSKIDIGNYISWETEYWLYPLTEDDPKSVINYLRHPGYNFSCIDFDNHTGGAIDGKNKYWRDADRAFWAYIHVRRQYPGCAIGVVFGKPKRGYSFAVNVLWYKEGGEIKYKYLDPIPKHRNSDVTAKFIPEMLFF